MIRTIIGLIAGLAVLTGTITFSAQTAHATQYSAYASYASAPAEILGKSTTGWKVLSAAEAAVVPSGSVGHRTNTQFMKVTGTGELYKVSNEQVVPLTTTQWRYEGGPSPRAVDRAPAKEYYSYASAPAEILVRTPLGTWRKATNTESASLEVSQIVRRANTYYLRNVGQTQVLKRVNGVTAPLTDAQWRGEGSPTPMVAELPESGSNPFTGHSPYVDPGYPSVAAATALRAAGNEVGAAQVDKISRHAGSKWIGDWNPVSKVRATVADYVQRALAVGQTGTLVLYGIPGRDCTGHSAGGFPADVYDDWINEIAAGVSGSRVAIVLEPDALLQLDRCPELQGDRRGLLRHASQTLTAAGATVYIDAGSSYSVPAAEMAIRLLDAGVLEVRGFATNVSNHKWTRDVRAYADELSRLLGGKRYVIDTSRNGNGDNGEWCNARGRAIGAVPGAVEYGTQDANLWIKTIGSSDGLCNGGPAAGKWWNEIAIELAANSAL